ncbi:MAG: hypothetical protein M1820_000015 [Bogoriella megaspora]|nr:MAG: hypothetical protein M1820_000015 [Bogoriella megaspora]
MEQHQATVARISENVASFHKKEKAFRIYHGSTNSTRQISWSRDEVVDTSDLNRVLNVDTLNMVAKVEPNVPMDAFVQETLKFGVIPEVVMEFSGITVGGGFSGTSGESSSFKYGLFENTIHSIEIILANGDVVTASETEKSDLFYGAASAFGSLGVITLLEVKLVRAKAYVAMTYRPVFSITEAVEETRKAAEDSTNDYVDGILFRSDFGVIMTGRLTDRTDAPVIRFTRPYDSWFYIHVERLFRSRKASTISPELIPVFDYFFRYDRGAFWTLKYAFQYFVTPFNRITRMVLDPFLRTRVAFKAFHAAGFGKEQIAQDCGLPASTVSEFIKYVDEEVCLYPLWLCPFSLSKRPEKSLNPSYPKEIVINVGVWGPGPKDHDSFITLNRSIEQKVNELGGLKCLYARAYYTEEEFWNIYDRKWYEELRAKYGAQTLPSVYEKTKEDLRTRDSSHSTWKSWLFAKFWDTWPIAGLYGVAKVIAGGEYLLTK